MTFEKLEPCAVKAACTVLMGAKAGNSLSLPGKEKLDDSLIKSVTGLTQDEIDKLKSKL